MRTRGTLILLEINLDRDSYREIFNNMATVWIMRKCFPGYDSKMWPLVNAITFPPLFSVL